MHCDGDRLDYIDARFVESHDTALGAWKKRLLFNHSHSSFFIPNKLQLDMPCVCCPKKRQYVAHLWTFVILRKPDFGLPDLIAFYTVLDRPFDSWPLLKLVR